jgi:hypothetical protein
MGDDPNTWAPAFSEYGLNVRVSAGATFTSEPMKQCKNMYDAKGENNIQGRESAATSPKTAAYAITLSSLMMDAPRRDILLPLKN